MRNSLVLSRFFYDNVNLVSGMCPKCYEEHQDVRIVSINTNFFKQYHHNVVNTIVETHTLGFTPKELDYNVRKLQQYQRYFNSQKGILEKRNRSSSSITKAQDIRKTYLRRLKEIRKEEKLKEYCKNNNQHSDGNFEEIFQPPDYKFVVKKEKQIANTLICDQRERIANFLLTELEFNRDNLKFPGAWIPPRSPHNLIEESLYYDPWALLVATIFLNRTSCAVARRYVFWFLTENPDPLTVLDKYPSDLEKYFVNLGLSRTRAVQIYRMSYDFIFKQWENVRQLYGIGEYGESAYRMFCLGDFSIEPKDRYLKIYKAWYDTNFNKQL